MTLPRILTRQSERFDANRASPRPVWMAADQLTSRSGNPNLRNPLNGAGQLRPSRATKPKGCRTRFQAGMEKDPSPAQYDPRAVLRYVCLGKVGSRRVHESSQHLRVSFHRRL